MFGTPSSRVLEGFRGPGEGILAALMMGLARRDAQFSGFGGVQGPWRGYPGRPDDGLGAARRGGGEGILAALMMGSAPEARVSWRP